jgi:hypothetical protein
MRSPGALPRLLLLPRPSNRSEMMWIDGIGFIFSARLLVAIDHGVTVRPPATVPTISAASGWASEPSEHYKYLDFILYWARTMRRIPPPCKLAASEVPRDKTQRRWYPLTHLDLLVWFHTTTCSNSNWIIEFKMNLWGSELLTSSHWPVNMVDLVCQRGSWCGQAH